LNAKSKNKQIESDCVSCINFSDTIDELEIEKKKLIEKLDILQQKMNEQEKEKISLFKEVSSLNQTVIESKATIQQLTNEKENFRIQLDNEKLLSQLRDDVEKLKQKETENANATSCEFLTTLKGMELDILCSICHINPRDALLQPCNHLKLCWECAHKIFKKKNTEERLCPICGGPIQSVLLINV